MGRYEFSQQSYETIIVRIIVRIWMPYRKRPMDYERTLMDGTQQPPVVLHRFHGFTGTTEETMGFLNDPQKTGGFPVDLPRRCRHDVIMCNRLVRLVW